MVIVKGLVRSMEGMKDTLTAALNARDGVLMSHMEATKNSAAWLRTGAGILMTQRESGVTLWSLRRDGIIAL